MIKCGYCGKKVEQTEGRRPKKFCDEKCRSAAHRKKVSELLKKASLDYQEKVFVETHDAVMEERTTTKGLLPTENNVTKKGFNQLLNDARLGIMDEKEMRMADLSPNQMDLLIRKNNENKPQ